MNKNTTPLLFQMLPRLPKPLRKIVVRLAIPCLYALLLWVKFRLWLLDNYKINGAWLKLLAIMILSYAAVVAMTH